MQQFCVCTQDKTTKNKDEEIPGVNINIHTMHVTTVIPTP